MKFVETRMYKFAKLKRYFDVGYGTTSYIKTVLVVLGISAAIARVRWEYLLIAGLLYGISCFFIGWLAFRVKFIEAEKEVENQYDHFVREMRKLSGAKVLNNP